MVTGLGNCCGNLLCGYPADPCHKFIVYQCGIAFLPLASLVELRTIFFIQTDTLPFLQFYFAIHSCIHWSNQVDSSGSKVRYASNCCQIQYMFWPLQLITYLHFYFYSNKTEMHLKRSWPLQNILVKAVQEMLTDWIKISLYKQGLFDPGGKKLSFWLRQASMQSRNDQAWN